MEGKQAQQSNWHAPRQPLRVLAPGGASCATYEHQTEGDIVCMDMLCVHTYTRYRCRIEPGKQSLVNYWDGRSSLSRPRTKGLEKESDQGPDFSRACLGRRRIWPGSPINNIAGFPSSSPKKPPKASRISPPCDRSGEGDPPFPFPKQRRMPPNALVGGLVLYLHSPTVARHASHVCWHWAAYEESNVSAIRGVVRTKLSCGLRGWCVVDVWSIDGWEGSKTVPQ